MTKFPLGALLEGDYVLPYEVEKSASGLSCPGCGECVIVKKGDIKAHHFSHKPGERECKFYEHPGEGEIHKMVKHIVAFLLKQRKIKKVVRSCPSGPSGKCTTFEERIEYEEGDEVMIEYRVSDKCIVDVAIINKGKLKYVFEICDTHKTIRETPEPWFEIDAKKFLMDTENGTRLKRHGKYKMDIDVMKTEDILQELCDGGSNLEGTLKERRERLQTVRNFDTSEPEECIYCTRSKKCCPSCKIRMAKFKVVRYHGIGNDTRIASVKQMIVKSKEYEECYPVIGAIKSIVDRKGELLVHVDGWKFKNSLKYEYIQDEFINLLEREWCGRQGEITFEIRDFKSDETLYKN